MLQRVFSVSFKSGVLVSTAGVFGSAFLWLLSFKAIAFWMGPEGVGLFSQLRQMVQAASVSATFGGTNSVVQGLAERQEESARRQFRATAVRLVGMAGVGVVLAMVVSAPQLSQFFLSSSAPDLVATVRWIALAVLLNVGGTYVLAVLNGYRSYPYLALAQTAGPAALMMLLAGAWWWRLSPDPQLLAGSFVICFGVTYLLGAFGVSRLPKLATTSRVGTLSKAQSRAYIRFALSNLVAALSSTAALLLIRSWVIEAKGLAFAGLFDAGWTLTFNYTTLFLTACSAIYVPLLTAATRPENQKACMLKTAYLVLGVSSFICYAMVLLKEPLINLLYSSQFQPSGQVVMVLVIAVMFRGVSWVFGAMILATRNSRVLLASDLVLNLSLLVTTRYALNSFASLEALSWAFVLPHFFYLLFVVEYARMKNPLMRRRQIWPLLVTGTTPLLYLALTSAGPQWEYAESSKLLCMVIGLFVSGTAILAYKKVVL
jgi:O-antigen/teichoic acid export membrane protein